VVENSLDSVPLLAYSGSFDFVRLLTALEVTFFGSDREQKILNRRVRRERPRSARRPSGKFRAVWQKQAAFSVGLLLGECGGWKFFGLSAAPGVLGVLRLRSAVASLLSGWQLKRSASEKCVGGASFL